MTRIKPDFPPRLLLSKSLSNEGPAWGSKPSGRVSDSRRGKGSSFATEVLLTGLEFRDDAPLMWSSWAVEEESIQRNPKKSCYTPSVMFKTKREMKLIPWALELVGAWGVRAVSGPLFATPMERRSTFISITSGLEPRTSLLAFDFSPTALFNIPAWKIAT